MAHDEVVKINAWGASAALFLASILGVLAAVLPWWTGASAVGTVADPRSQQAEATLWSFTLGVAVPDPEDVTQTTIEPMTATWNDVCAAAANSAAGAPGACGLVQAIRAFTLLTLLLGSIGGGMLLAATRVTPLLMLPGALVAILTGLVALCGVILGVATETSGLNGTGIICLLAAAGLAFAATGFAMYAATQAMKELEGEAYRMPRQERAEAARQKERDLSEQLEAGLRKGRRGSQASGSSSSNGGGKKPPVMLKKVLFWSQSEGADGEEIPTSMLEMAFREIDKTGDGSIDIDELVEALQLCGLNVQGASVDVIMREIDKNMSGDIDIHEFVEFFRNLEELSRFDQKSQQQAQFLTFVCNFCFVIHIIIVSVLLMNFINLQGDTSSDSYLIMKNMLIAFSAVLCLLLVFVIFVPALRLTLGQNIATWQRAYEAELKARLKKKPTPGQQNQGGVGSLRQAAWQQDSHVSAVSGHVPVNAALHGASYRTSKQQQQQQQQQIYDDRPEMTQIPEVGDFDAQDNFRQAHQQLGAPQPIERYDPSAYRYAAMLAVEARQASSFSPMQVRDLDVPPDQLQPAAQPGMLALTGGGPY